MPPIPRRRTIILIVLGVALCIFGVLVAAALQGLGVLPVKTRSEIKGKFEIRYKTYDAFGHRATGQDLYYRGILGNRLVSKRVGSYEFHPSNDHAVIYEHCPSTESSDCGIYYFDGHSGSNFKASSQPRIESSIEWSPDGRFVAVAGQFDLAVADLQKHKTFELGQTLDLHPGPDHLREIALQEWSPGSEQILATVYEFTDEAPPYVNVIADLISIDSSDGSVSYIASKKPRGWNPALYSWNELQTQWELTELGRSSSEVFRKKAFDLPPGWKM